MKRYLYIIVCLSFFAFSSCRKNTQKDPDNYVVESIAKDVVSNEIQELQTIDATASAEFKGKMYNMRMIRKADANLPIVADAQGVRYYDNTISLRINSGDREIINKDFTKNTFASYLAADVLQHAILEGLVVDKVTEYGLMFAASVSYPESDLYVPFHVTVLPNGVLSIDKADLMEDYEPDVEPEQNN